MNDRFHEGYNFGIGISLIIFSIFNFILSFSPFNQRYIDIAYIIIGICYIIYAIKIKKDNIKSNSLELNKEIISQ